MSKCWGIGFNTAIKRIPESEVGERKRERIVNRVVECASKREVSEIRREGWERLIEKRTESEVREGVREQKRGSGVKIVAES